MSGPTFSDYVLAAICFTIAGLSLLALLAMAAVDRVRTRRRLREQRPPESWCRSPHCPICAERRGAS